MRGIIIILVTTGFFCLSTLPVHAQNGGGSVIVEEPVHYDEEGDLETGVEVATEDYFEYERVYMDENELEAFRRRKEFQYNDLDSIAAADSFYMERPKTTKTRPSNGFGGFDVSVLVWLIVAIAIVVIILQVAGINMRQLFSSRKLATHTDDSNILSENIHEIPYETAIRQAIAAGNYSLATRLMYLQSLKILSDKNLISWHQHKTNWQYVYELKNEGLRNSFRSITHIFEYVQYGHMPISADKFDRVQEAFRHFKQHVV